jgi:hypothetical protein
MDHRPQQLVSELVGVADEGSEQPAPGRAVVGPPVVVEARCSRGERTLEHDGAFGSTSSTPRAAQSTVRKNGDAATSGTIDEHTSWRNPGSVSSMVRVPPPIVGARS